MLAFESLLGSYRTLSGAGLMFTDSLLVFDLHVFHCPQMLLKCPWCAYGSLFDACFVRTGAVDADKKP